MAVTLQFVGKTFTTGYLSIRGNYFLNPYLIMRDYGEKTLCWALSVRKKKKESP